MAENSQASANPRTNAPLGPRPTPEQLGLTRYVQLVAVAIIVGGCYLVLHSFIPAILFAVVVCSATWPLYLRLRDALWGRPALAALIMTLLVTMLVIGPTML